MTRDPTPSTRINARIDRVAEEQLRYVTEHTRMNVTDALRAAIALMYDKVSREHASPAAILARGPSFVGAGASADDSGSTGYKDELARAWATRGTGDADR
jgi:hypothetical protein